MDNCLRFNAMQKKCEKCGAYSPGSSYDFYVGEVVSDISGSNFEPVYDFSLIDSAFVCNICIDREVFRKYGSNDNAFIGLRKFIRNKYTAKTKSIYFNGKETEIPPSLFWIILYGLLGYKKKDPAAKDLCSYDDYKNIGSLLAIDSKRIKHQYNAKLITPREKASNYTRYTDR
jgi:hypothetical protein